jgi:hypothetical protein
MQGWAEGLLPGGSDAGLAAALDVMWLRHGRSLVQQDAQDFVIVLQYIANQGKSVTEADEFLVPTRLNCEKVIIFYLKNLKGHGNEADFLGFLHKSVRHRSLTVYTTFPISDFSFEFAEIFVIERRLPDSPSRGVDKNAYRYNFFQVFK